VKATILRFPSARSVALVTAGFVAGVIVSAGVAARADGADGLYRKLDLLAQVLAQIEGRYVDAVGPTELVYGAARGAVRTLDEHSAFFDPAEFKQLVETTDGEYAGIGLELDGSESLPLVTAVTPGSPAERAGIHPGDHLLSVDGESVHGYDVERVQQRLRGPAGSKLTLGVRRRGRDDDWTFTLVRSWVRVSPLSSRDLGGGVLYVELKTFSRRVAADLGALLEKAPEARGLVLDLRGNPGGLFDEAVATADLFLTDGPIVTTVGRGGRVLERLEAHAQGHEPAYPVAVLIDKDSASAAEVVAGCLTDRKRARLFGTPSYGKGSVQSVIPLADEAGLKLTVARYFTPSGRPIDKVGITPDEVVEPAPGADAPLAAAVKWLSSKP
jgi:carboxyl-terminal processing protease